MNIYLYFFLCFCYPLKLGLLTFDLLYRVLDNSFNRAKIFFTSFLILPSLSLSGVADKRLGLNSGSDKNRKSWEQQDSPIWNAVNMISALLLQSQSSVERADKPAAMDNQNPLQLQVHVQPKQISNGIIRSHNVIKKKLNKCTRVVLQCIHIMSCLDDHAINKCTMPFLHTVWLDATHIQYMIHTFTLVKFEQPILTRKLCN